MLFASAISGYDPTSPASFSETRSSNWSNRSITLRSSSLTHETLITTSGREVKRVREDRHRPRNSQ